MINYFGTTNLATKTFLGYIDETSIEVNKFLNEHDGNIVDIQALPTAEKDLLKVLILYRETPPQPTKPGPEKTIDEAIAEAKTVAELTR